MLRNAMAEPTPLLCFTDVVCGFCYLADARFEQLKTDFGSQIPTSRGPAYLARQ